MSSINPVAPVAADGLASEAERLRLASKQLEGVFMSYVMRAMRETVPDGGLLGGGAAIETFTAIFDEHLAEAAAMRMDRGLGEALYRQLSRHLISPMESK